MSGLKDALNRLSEQNRVTALSRYSYLAKEAERKHYEATAILGAQGKSHAEKVTLAQSTKGWLDFHADLAKVESRYQFELFKLKILELEFQSLYLEAKQDGRDISRERANDERQGV
jgi:hypothetical protein